MRHLKATAYLAFAAAIGLGLAAPRSAQAACAGDCNSNGVVTITEVINVVNLALEINGTPACAAADTNGDNRVDVVDVVATVNVAVLPGGACPPMGTPCGNRVVDAGEDCDVGGSCVGGSKSGTACTQESDCGASEPGVCNGGTGAFRQCDSDADCGGGTCRRCTVYGGAAVEGSSQTCGANCTFETQVPFVLKKGVFSGINLTQGSGAVVHSGILGDVPLALEGEQTLSVAKASADGNRPFSLKAASVKFAPIPVSTLACACLRGIPAKTCGGFVLAKNGDLGLDCSEGLSTTVCPTTLPCAFVHGPGNSGTGMLGCGTTPLTPANLSVSQDSLGSADPAECLTPGIGAPTCADPPVIGLSGTSSVNGAGILVTHSAIGVKVGSCAGFCTDADPVSTRGSVNPLVLTTGSATGLVTNSDGQDGIDNGPYTVNGAAVNSCTALVGGTATGDKLAGAFTAINQNMLGDIVVTAVFEAQ